MLKSYWANLSKSTILVSTLIKAFLGTINWHKVIQKNYWTMRMEDIYLGGKKMNFCGKEGCKAVVDSGTSVFTTPNKYYSKLMKAMKIKNCKNKDG